MSEQNLHSESEKEQKERVKKLNRRVYTIVAIIVPIYVAHVRLSYGNWSFITDLFKGDPITIAIYMFVALLLFMVYMTYAFFRKHL